MSISSSRMVPSPAASNFPTFATSAPVNAPRAWPKNSLAIRLPERVPQATTRNRLARRAEQSWTSLARNVLPVPVSPSMSTVTSWAAAMQSWSTIAVSDGVWLTSRRRILSATVSAAGSGNGAPSPRPRAAHAVSSRLWCGHTHRPTRWASRWSRHRAARTASVSSTAMRAGNCCTRASRTTVSSAAASAGSAATSSRSPSASGVSRCGTSSARTAGAETWAALSRWDWAATVSRVSVATSRSRRGVGMRFVSPVGGRGGRGEPTAGRCLGASAGPGRR